MRTAQTLLTALSGVAAAPPDTAAPDESARMKIQLIQTLARFVKWPPAAAPDELGQWRFCFIGTGDPTVDQARRWMPEQLADIPVEVRTRRFDEAVTGCHIVYLSDGVPEQRMLQALDTGEYGHALTISDSYRFARRGGMIELVRVRERYRFDVDYSKVLDGRLNLDSGMLKLARRVH